MALKKNNILIYVAIILCWVVLLFFAVGNQYTFVAVFEDIRSDDSQ